MGDVLAREGYVVADAPVDADLVILNTCHIREKAAEKVYSELGRLRSLKESGMLIAVAGCVAQAEGEEIMRRAPYVDFVVMALVPDHLGSHIFVGAYVGLPFRLFLV